MRYIPHYCHVDDGIVFYLKSQILNSSIASSTVFERNYKEKDIGQQDSRSPHW